MAALDHNRLGDFLKDRRARLDPAARGFTAGRRRTPGLRREEVAQRAHVSATWYTWLEQGRGGAPSTDVLDRLARALELDEAEREHLFLLAQRRPPEARYAPSRDIQPGLRRMIDALEFSPAIVRTSAWDVVAWNRAAAAVLTDYAALPPERRNVLRLLFLEPRVRAAMPDWEEDARHAVAAFRHGAMRANACDAADALVADLCRESADFARMWRDGDVLSAGEGRKAMVHPLAGRLAFEYASFDVGGRPDLGLLVYSPATTDDLAAVRRLMEGRRGAPSLSAPIPV